MFQAALTNQMEVVEYLLSMPGVAQPPTDLLGITPMDVARAAGHVAIADKLQQFYCGRGGQPKVTLHNGDGGCVEPGL